MIGVPKVRPYWPPDPVGWVKTVIATVHVLVAKIVGSAPEQVAVGMQLIVMSLKEMMQEVTAEPQLFVVAGQDTTTLPPEMTTVACPSQAGTSEARIVAVAAD